MIKRISLVAAVFLSLTANAQQFIGMSPLNYSAVHLLPANPAWVNNARTAPEVNLFAGNVLAGNNAYFVNASILSTLNGGDAKEDRDFGRLDGKRNVKAWANADVMGPAVSFTYKKQYQFGVYTRFRSIVNGGNVTKPNFDIVSNDKHPQFFNHTLTYENVGAVAHAFGEFGISAGKMLRDDDYIKIGVGANIKYLVGYAAINAYSNSITYQRLSDSLIFARGDATLLYTYNTSPGSMDPATRAGRGGLGLDIGFFYEFYGNMDPNITVPYKFSIAASITDIGSVGYVGDAGSGKYNITGTRAAINTVELQDNDKDEFYSFLGRLSEIGYVRQTENAEKFRIGLPTAFRLNTDWNAGSKIYVSVNTLLNLKGNNGEVYNPGYASYLNITPRIDLKALKFGLPITFVKYRTMNLGAILYMGPLFIGSSSILTAATGQNVQNFDVYAGLGWKFFKSNKVRMREYDNGTNPEGIRRFIPRFLRGNGRGVDCPPQRFRNNEYKSYYK